MLWLTTSHHYFVPSYSLKVRLDNTVKQKIIDRCFIDETGVMWIVDYKTSSPQLEENKEAFIERKVARYRHQLLEYKSQLSVVFDNKAPIKTALYFTYYPHWQEVEL